MVSKSVRHKHNRDILVLFCCVLNVTNDQGELIKQKLVYFDGKENEPIFVDIDQPLASGMGLIICFFFNRT